MKILVFNFGSTSSKVAVYEDSNELFAKTINHDQSLLEEHKVPIEQYDVRKADIFAALDENGFKFEDFDAVCSRAGLIRSVESGTYRINEQCVADAKDFEYGGMQPHGLALIIADSIAKEYGIPAFFCDPVSTDEMTDLAKTTGYAPMKRISRFHALNHKAVARQCAADIGKPYEDLNLVGLHLGGGTSVVAHDHGRVVDLTDCSEDGPFSMDRPGALPLAQVIEMCYESGMSKKELRTLFKRDAGVYSLCGTRDMREVEARMNEGDKDAEMAFKAFAYNHAKYTGAMAAVLKFKVDGIYITGGIANGKRMVEEISQYIEGIAPIYVYPGENEMQSLAEGALRVLRGEAEAKEYKA
ncbi:MAG: butyrate kinase [Firmicutes bacterium]|nr:butyrate kinase [Bacillota bacterium]